MSRVELPILPRGCSTGDRVLVSYEDSDSEPYFHERLLIGHVGGSQWIVATPDLDVYLEDLVEGVEECLPVGVRGGLPPRARRYQCHRFAEGVLMREKIASLMQEGSELAEQERERLVPQGAGDAGYGGRPAPAEAQGEWHAVEDRGGFGVGDVLRFGPSSVASGDRALIQLNDGTWIGAARPGTYVMTPRPGGRPQARPAAPAAPPPAPPPPWSSSGPCR